MNILDLILSAILGFGFSLFITAMIGVSHQDEENYDEKKDYLVFFILGCFMTVMMYGVF